jgi:hypothetical protein
VFFEKRAELFARLFFVFLVNLQVEQNDTYWKIIKMRVWEKRIEDIFDIFRQNKIEPILIKGWAVSRFYPNTWERPFSDIDLLIRTEESVKAELLLSEHKLTDVDLHFDLSHLDSTSIDKLFVSSKLVKCGESDVRVLSYEDNLRVVCVHWLIDGGEYKWKLQDIKYLIENCSNDFNWDKCLNVVSKKRRKWILVTIALAHKYFDLDIKELPFYTEILQKNFLPKWLINHLEKIWSSDQIGLVGLHKVFTKPKEFIKQISKRFPPNPIQATIEIGGEINNTPRIFYQIANVLWRIPPFLLRIIGKIFRNKKLQDYKW